MPTQLQRIKREIQTSVVFKIECQICSEEYEQESEVKSLPFSVPKALSEASQSLKQEGWKYLINKEYELEGIHCPQCASEAKGY